jgi:hypothetical protein
VSVEVKLNVWRKIAEIITKFLENGGFANANEMVKMLLSGLSPVLALKLNAKLDVTVDDYM